MRHSIAFMAELKVEQRHYTRENRMLMHSRKSLVLQERMYFRNIPLSDWIEHEIVMDDNTDVNRLVQDMTVFDKGVVSIAESPARSSWPDRTLFNATLMKIPPRMRNRTATGAIGIVRWCFVPLGEYTSQISCNRCLCGPGRRLPDMPAEKGDAAKGKAVFEQCGVCHNPDSDERKWAPGLKGLFKKDKMTNGKKPTDATVRAQIDEGGNGMPAYKDMLSDTGEDDLIAYLKTL